MTDTTVLAITGPPAAGKSTVTDMLDDIGVPCKSTGEAVREIAAERYDDPTEDDAWTVAKDLRLEHGNAGPVVACRDWIDEHSVENDLLCVADLRHSAEVSWLRTHVGPTLVLRIDADQTEREYRYVERELDDQNLSIEHDRISELRSELRGREERESPYPDHDAMIWNDDDTNMFMIMNKLENIVEVMRA